MTTALERIAIVIAALALAVAVIALLSGGLLTGSDKATVAAPVSGPGHPYAVGPRDPLARELRLGDVALLYGSAKAPPGLPALARRLALPVSSATGQAIILVSRSDVHGILALAWDRALRASSPEDPRLSAFVDYWLGRGAGSPG